MAYISLDIPWGIVHTFECPYNVLYVTNVTIDAFDHRHSDSAYSVVTTCRALRSVSTSNTVELFSFSMQPVFSTEIIPLLYRLFLFLFTFLESEIILVYPEGNYVLHFDPITRLFHTSPQ